MRAIKTQTRAWKDIFQIKLQDTWQYEDDTLLQNT